MSPAQTIVFAEEIRWPVVELKHIYGKVGENAACRYLKKKGYDILERNYRKRYGEIDIIAQKDDLCVFVEVKTRADTAYGMASEAVTKTKQNKMVRTAKCYIMEHDLDAVFSFDVIEVYHKGLKVLSVNHIENAFYV